MKDLLINATSATFGFIGGINECITLFNWARSKIAFWGTQQNGTQEQQPQDGVLRQLRSDLEWLETNLQTMYELIDRTEWRSHKENVEKLLPKLKDAVYDADDLLDEFGWYETKAREEGDADQLSPFKDFFRSITHGSFNKVIDIQKRLSSLFSQVEKMGLHEATPRFDKSIRPVTTSFPTEPKIFGREKDLEEVIGLLGVPNHSSRSSSKRKRTSNAANNASLPVLPIVGIGGIGKTTLAQEITTRVKSHFDKIIWICVSDDFDEERFTKVLIKSLSGKEATTDNLDDLQQDLFKEVGKKRFLLVLDDIWPDALKDGGQCWRKFCAPFKNVLQGSMMLVTTRFDEVSDDVGTMKPFKLEGLKDDVFWNFFKLCVFGPEDFHIDPQLELIGKSILPKLKGTPLAAKTIGRLLRKSLKTAHWNNILNSELWQPSQKETDILPALRLSYMYLPFYLKRCFSFCAVYPKDYNFEKASLAEIWVAEGFVKPQGSGTPLLHIGYQYFDELVNLSFFQKLHGKYVIHDLMHDMAQLVSKEECFIVKNASDVENVPQNVRHLSILSDVKSSDIQSLWKHTKLRTLLCHKSLRKISTSVIDRWFNELQCLRVIRCASMSGLPETIGNQKHLRYLEISRACPIESLPSSFCSLYNLQIFYAKKCNLVKLPTGISKLINLQKFESDSTKMEVDAAGVGEQIGFINKFYKDIRDWTIYNLGAIIKDHAAEVELRKIEYLNSLTLRWDSWRCSKHNETEVLQALQPPTNIKSVHLDGYPGEYLPSWFGGCGRVGTIFGSLTELSIESCQKLSSLEQFLQPAYMPFLEELKVSNCPMINSQRLLAPPLKKLTLYHSGNLGDNIDCSSLTKLGFYGSVLASIELEKCSLPVLQELVINDCQSLKFITFGSLPFLKDLDISRCPRLNWQSGRVFPPSLQTLMLARCGDFSAWSPSCLENLTSLESLEMYSCKGIVSIPGDLWRSNSESLKKLKIVECPDLVSIGGPEAIAKVDAVYIRGCPKLKEIEQILARGEWYS